MKLPAISPRRTRKKWRVPDLRNGFSNDLLDGIHLDMVAKAEAVEIDLLTFSAQQALAGTPRVSFMEGLRNKVARAIGLFTREARKVDREATALAKASAEAVITDYRPYARMAPKRPRNVDIGATVRTPKTLVKAVQDMGPVLYGSGSYLFDDIARAILATPPESDAQRRAIAQNVLDDFRKRGITAFVDKSGRKWNLVSYVEMATRTAAGNAAMGAYLDELVKAGLDVVRVTIMPNCHPFCQPFQGRLLSITGGSTHAPDGEPVVCSIAEAIARGFRHPNCRHTVKVHLTGMIAPDPDKIDVGDYKATQDLRALEREVRRLKREKAITLDPQAKTGIERKIRATQRDIREHVAKTGIVRNRYREQIKKAL